MTFSSEFKEFGRVLLLVIAALFGIAIIVGHYWLMRHPPEWYIWIFAFGFFGFGMYGLKAGDLSGFVGVAGKAWREFKGSGQQQ